MFVVCSLMFVVCPSSVVRWSLFVFRRFMFVVCWSLFAARCTCASFGVRCLLSVVYYCLAFVVDG